MTESQSQTIDIAIDMAKQRAEEDQERQISREDFNKYKEGIENRLESLDLALDVAKEIAEQDNQDKITKTEFKVFKETIEDRLEVLDMTIDVAKQRNEEDHELNKSTKVNLKERTEKIERILTKLTQSED